MDRIEYEKTIKACRFCLMCRHMCTVGNISYAEANTPRGHALMLDCVGGEALADTSENRSRMAEIWFGCCYCGHCQNNCVSSYPHPDAMMTARAEADESHLPERAKALRAIVAKTGEFYENPVQAGGASDAAKGKAGADVLLYIGSFTRNEDSGVADAAISVLEKAGVSYTLLADEKGVGMAPFLMGMTDVAQTQLAAEIEKINALKPGMVVTLSPDDLRVLAGGVSGLDASGLTAPVTGFAAFTLGLVKAGALALSGGGAASATPTAAPALIAYHDSDQGGRFLQDYDAPRELVQSIPGIAYKELFWAKGEAASAGESGAIRLLNPELASKIAEKRIGQIAGRGVSIVATDSPEAKAQLVGQGNKDVKFMHIAELIKQHIA
ncbi:MAG: (Fe-S)-binding protein [Clostridiales bacterium]|nr:(Fe-S)-binding protein [Clostridiales bacterium]